MPVLKVLRRRGQKMQKRLMMRDGVVSGGLETNLVLLKSHPLNIVGTDQCDG